MPPAGSKTGLRAARLAVAATCVLAPKLACAQQNLVDQPAVGGFAGLALGLGLVGFATATALRHLAGRRRWARRESELLAEIDHLRQNAERAHAFLAAEPQLTAIWGGARAEAEIEGDLSLALDAPGPARRALAFGTWLPAEDAAGLEADVLALRERGLGFRRDLVTLSGRCLEAEGRAIGSRVALRLRDVSTDRREATRLRQLLGATEEHLAQLRRLLDLSPLPAWTRGPDEKIDWANSAFLRATDAATPEDAAARGLELFDRPARDAAARAREKNQIWRGRDSVVVAGARRVMEGFDAALPGGSGGMAQDFSEFEALRVDHARQVESHIRTLDQISTAIAIFDRAKKLVFANAAYRALWDLDAGFLDQGPSDSEILDHLRAARKLPEQADYRGWKASLHQVYQTLDPAPQVWHLPDGRTLRVAFDPNPQGGVTYFIEDVTERFALESQYNALARLQSETLDALQEGVAVFGPDGRLRLCNPAFLKLWGLPENLPAERPHIDFITAAGKTLLPDDAIWADLRSAIAGLHAVRMGFSRKMNRSDGSVVDCALAPLPDGAALLTFIDVTDGAKVERALKERNQALLAAEQLRNDFVHHVSYELRSPLTNIIGFIQLLGDGSVGPLNEKQREYAGYVLKSSAALLAIINDILDLASIDRDAMELKLGDVDIEQAMRDAANGLVDRLAESHVDLSIVAPPGIGAFRADGQRIRQILFNLLSNAIGFSEPGQSVTLAALRRDDEIVFKVTDRGRGIPPEVLEKVFDRFESHGLPTRHRGVGLGLSIVKAFVELHGGTVHIDSALGEGTVVTCIFPTRGGAILARPDSDGRLEGWK